MTHAKFNENLYNHLKTKAMKTRTIIAAISLALIIVGSTALINNVKAGNHSTPVTPIDKSTITYVVNISHDGDINQVLKGYVLALTDEQGRTIGTPKAVIPGTWVYMFYESGPANGVRTARLVKAPPVLGPVMLYTPASIHGPFDAGATYMMTVYPIKEINKGNTIGIR
jgi:hypothetical protein